MDGHFRPVTAMQYSSSPSDFPRTRLRDERFLNITVARRLTQLTYESPSVFFFVWSTTTLFGWPDRYDWCIVFELVFGASYADGRKKSSKIKRDRA